MAANGSQEAGAGTSGGRSPRGQGNWHWVALGVAVAALVISLCALVLSSPETLLAFFSGQTLDPEKVEVDAAAFRDYFKVEAKRFDLARRALVLTLKRTKAFPLKDSDYETLAERTTRTLAGLLPLEALARGYVRCECFGKNKEFLGFTFERIRGLVERETLDLAVPLPRRRSLQGVVITY